MKRMLAVMACVCLGLTACGAPTEEYPYYDMHIYNMAANAMFAYSVNSLREVEEHATLIVRARIVGREIIDDDYHYGHIYSRMEILQVYSGIAMVGDTLWLNEGCCTYVQEGERLLRIAINELPSELGKEYLFFLEGDRIGRIFPDRELPLEGQWVYSDIMDRGRFPSLSWREDPDDLTPRELCLWHDDPVYREIFRQAVKKYH